MSEVESGAPPAAAWTLEFVKGLLNKQAASYIAGRNCEFEIEAHSTQDCLIVKMEVGSVSDFRSYPFADESPSEMVELYDTAIVGLTHMAVKCGLIETTPSRATHHVTVIGDREGKTEIQLDGHTLRGLYSATTHMQAGEAYTVKLEFIRAAVHFDQEVLPENILATIAGFDAVIELLDDIADARKEAMKDIEWAKGHSSEEEVALYRRIHDAIVMYKPSEDGLAAHKGTPQTGDVVH